MSRGNPDMMLNVYNTRGESLDIRIRLARPDDAPQLIALLIKQHGNNYPNRQFYDETAVRRNIEAEILHFSVIELMDGTLAGMIGADEGNVFSGSIVFFLLTIDPLLRGFGVGNHLHRFLLEHVALETYTSIYGYCLTLDTISQKICNNLGYRMTGLLLNRYIYDTTAENLVNLSLPFKRTHLVVCFPRIKQDTGILYTPFAHVAYIGEVYESLGVAYRFDNHEETKPKAMRSLLTITPYEDHRYCEVMIRETGHDFASILGDLLKQYGAREQQTFNAFINLNDPGCPDACRVLAEQGFFFTGLQPLSGDYEYMIMHYAPRLPVPFDKIAVIPEFNKRFSYIQHTYQEAQHDRKN
ncbi:MAG: GNAT family N-acetyltransferase [Treponema sp.]|jgi:GNAT superfamily N-acetyltransferase|nr:GNAT family N-acetyltransferase [Treponema sp.]